MANSTATQLQLNFHSTTFYVLFETNPQAAAAHCSLVGRKIKITSENRFSGND
ncbi:hypothetical protein [Collimonas antrihumi]|uniref:hypothetical protein n=1 Tax=Collimonas antrihumi TaxID=1940615 RepID=UPI001B8AF14E|nr:hypothetical protein [Collimonas antrihumi]